MHDGSAAQAADLFRWLGPYPDAFVSAAGAIVAVAAGDLEAARAALSAESAGPPTSTARAARSLAEGLLLSLDQPFPIAVARLGQSITDRTAAAGRRAGHPRRAGHAGRAARRRSGACPQRDRQGRARRQPDGQRRRVLCCPPAPTAARLGADAGRAAARGRRRRRRRRPMPRCTAATRSGRRRCRPRSPGAAATAVRCRSIGMPRWKCSPSTRWTFSLCCRWASCGWRRRRMRQVDRLQHTLDRGVRPARVARQSGAVVGAAALGRACTPGSWPIHRKRLRRTARR